MNAETKKQIKDISKWCAIPLLVFLGVMIIMSGAGTLISNISKTAGNYISDSALSRSY